MDSIEEIRERINALDRQMAELYQERMALMDKVAEYKRLNSLPVLDKEREEMVKRQNSALIKDTSLKPYYMDFIQFIMDQGKEMQEQLIGKDSNLY